MKKSTPLAKAMLLLTLAGLAVSHRDLEDLRLIESTCVHCALPALVGWDATTQPLKSDANAVLVKQVSHFTSCSIFICVLQVVTFVCCLFSVAPITATVILVLHNCFAHALVQAKSSPMHANQLTDALYTACTGNMVPVDAHASLW